MTDLGGNRLIGWLTRLLPGFSRWRRTLEPLDPDLVSNLPAPGKDGRGFINIDYHDFTGQQGPLWVDFGQVASPNRQYFRGQQVASPNRQWVLAYGHIHDPDVDEWSSDDPTGAVLLYRNSGLACQVRGLYRPDSVALCDAGVFAINEEGVSTNFLGPETGLCVYQPSGKLSCRFQPGAAIQMASLSSDGSLLAFHTLAAPPDSASPDDDGKLFVVDTRSGVIRWRAELPVIWPTRIEFDEMNGTIVLSGPSNDKYRYTFEGEFLDARAVEQAALERDLANDYGYPLIDRACQALPDITQPNASKDTITDCVDLLQKALRKRLSPNTKARAHRILGEIAESRGDHKVAIKAYQIALKLNPKVGVKKRLEALRKLTA
jgi:tetratricopeptide (TPR) repeat protein